MTDPRLRILITRWEAKKAAAREFSRAVAKVFQINSRVQWDWHGHRQFGRGANDQHLW